MANLMKSLGKQVGPLPMGAWIAVVGGGLVIAYFVNKNQKANADETDASLTDPDSDVGVGGGQFQYDPIQQVPVETPEDNDNAAWGRKAINYLTSLGYAGSYAQNVISKFLAAEPISPNEKLLVDIVILRFGSPPEPIAPTEGEPNPPTPPTPPKVVPGPIRGLRVTRSTRVNTVHWTYAGPTIAGFVLVITDLKSRHKKTVSLGAGARSYSHRASPAWTSRSAGVQQYYIRAHTSAKVQGRGATVSAKHKF
jgi:hypothetical protein